MKIYCGEQRWYTVDQEALIKEMVSIPGKIISLHDGAYLFREGAPARYFYIVRSGHIFIVKYGASTRGSLIGELPLYEEEPTYIFSALARSAAEVYAIEFPVLQAYLEKHPHLSIALLKLLGMHMRKQHLKFRDLVLYGKKGALYSTLIRLANSYGMETEEGILISVPLTNQELANYSASARESLNRMLADLKRRGVIEMRGHLILIKNIDFLKGEIHCENCGKEICNIE